jgi:hypothetical protein
MKSQVGRVVVGYDGPVTIIHGTSGLTEQPSEIVAAQANPATVT